MRPIATETSAFGLSFDSATRQVVEGKVERVNGVPLQMPPQTRLGPDLPPYRG